MDFERLKEMLKEKARLTALSFLFLTGTTFVSCIMVYTTLGSKYFNLISAIVGGFMGQVVLLMAMNLIAVLYEKKDNEIETP